MKKLTLTLSIVFLIGFQGIPQNTIADGNTTIKESRQMQQSWCEYNKGRDFIKDQCE